MGLIDSLSAAFGFIGRLLQSIFGASYPYALTYLPIANAVLSLRGLDFLKRHESPGGRPILKAYRDIRGIATIGHGHKIVPGDGLSLASVITPAEAEILLLKDLQTAVNAVRRAVRVPVTQNQFDAMVSLAYNIGAGAFAGSDVVRLLNAGNVAGARAAFSNWSRAGSDPTALASRRADEQALFATA